MQLVHFTVERAEEQLHQGIDFFLRPAPILAGKQGQRRYASSRQRSMVRLTARARAARWPITRGRRRCCAQRQRHP